MTVKSMAAAAALALALASCSDGEIEGSPSTGGTVTDECPSAETLGEATGEEFEGPDEPDGEWVFEGLGCVYYIGNDPDQFRPKAVIFFHQKGTELEEITAAFHADAEVEVDGADEAYSDDDGKFVVITVGDRVVSVQATTKDVDEAVTVAQVALGTA